MEVNITQACSQAYSCNNTYFTVAGTLAFTTLWAFSVDDKLMIFFLFFPEKQDLTFHAGDNLHEMSGDNLHEMAYPVFWDK